tara:strand:+ start:13730 stop:15205 length:1476 start_codon:yes stop_codon:yes gene_type:complete
MGIIEKQASKSTIYIYIGIAIGFLNTLLFPRFLSADQKGILDAITSASFLLTSIFTLGLPLLTLRHFPKFRDQKNKNNGFLGFTFLVTIIGTVTGLIFLIFIFKQKVNPNYQTLFYFLLLFFAFLFRLLFSNLDAIIRMTYNAVLGVLSSNLVLKLINLTSIILYAIGLIELKILFIIFVIGLCSPGIISFIYVLIGRNFGLSISSFFRKVQELNLKQDLIKTSVFGFFGSIGGVMVLEIDRIMLLDLMGTTEVGIYTTAALFGVVVNVPTRSLRGISGAVISEAWKNNDLKTIDTVFKKSTLNLQIISGYLFICILICSPYLFALMKPEYSLGINIILYIALAQFVDAFTSVNTEILSSSTLYKYQTFFIFLMIGLVVGLNYLLIPLYGIKGAAISTMISLCSINIFRTIFIWIKFKIHPFKNKNLYVFILLVTIYTLSFFINKLFEVQPIFKFLIMMSFITLLFWFFVLKFKLSNEITEKVKKIFVRLK